MKLDAAVQQQYLDLAATSSEAKLAYYRSLSLETTPAGTEMETSTIGIDLLVRLSATFTINAFETPDIHGRRWSSVFLLASRFSHSCLPNAESRWYPDSNTLSVHAVKDLTPGQEVTVSYVPLDMEREARLSELRRKYDFECRCEACGD